MAESARNGFAVKTYEADRWGQNECRITDGPQEIESTPLEEQ